jgi:CheY-like chemotaxis protein
MNSTRMLAVKVLVTDDHVDSADALAEVLEGLGYTVAKAYNGAQALDVAEQFKPDLVVMDINMPVMDGWTAARAFRSGSRDTGNPVLVALTANSKAVDRQRSLDAGFDAHVSKPVFIDELETLLSRYRKGQVE